MSRSKHPDLAELLANAAWLRTLALAMSGQPDMADDAVQLTWESALRRPPDPTRPSKPWLAQVVRNFLNKHRRSEKRRWAYESKAAFEAEPWAESAETMAEKAEAYRLLTQLVANLDERKRTIVLLRYCEEKTAALIGQQLDLPAGTVRRLLAEAGDELAHQMDDAYRGQRKVWLGAFVPMGAGPFLPFAKLSKANTWYPLRGWVWPLSGLAVVATGIVLMSLQSGPPAVGRHAAKRSFNEKAPGLLAQAEAQLSEVTVQVTSLQNAPISDAVVLLTCKHGCGPHAAQSRAATRADGSVSFKNLTTGKYEAVAHDPKYGSAYNQIDVAQPHVQLKLRLATAKGALTLSGTALDDGGGVVAGAIVTAARDAVAVGISITNDKGQYEMRLDKGVHLIAVQASGYALHEATFSIEGELTYNVNLSAGAHLSGLVVRGLDGTPSVGALVSLKAQTKEVTLRTDTQGRFETHNLRADDYVISAQDGELWGTSTTAGKLVAGQSVDVGRIELSHTPTVTAHVIDSTGKAVSEADIRMEPMPYDLPDMVMEGKQMGRTNKSGDFVLRGLPGGRYMLRAGKDGFAWSVATFALKEDDISISFRLAKEVRVSGRVVDVEGRPVSNASVALETRDARDIDAVFTGSSLRFTDDQGRFEADQLGAGWLRVEVNHPLHGAIARNDLAVQLGDTKSLDLRFAAPLFINGQVVWDDGKPASNVIVEWMGGPVMPRTHTDAGGRFKLGPLSAGIGGVSAKALESGMSSCCGGANGKVLELKAEIVPEDVKLVLERLNHKISGIALSPENQPLPGVTVYAVDHPGVPPFVLTQAPHASSDAEGRFAIENVAAREYALVAQAQGYARAVTKVSVLRKDVKIRFERAGRVYGFLVDDSGIRVPSFEVAAVTSLEKIAPEHLMFGSVYTQFKKVSQPSGQFQIEDLGPGLHDVIARLPDGRVGVAGRVRVRGGETTKLQVVAGPAGVAKGRLIDAKTGKGVANLGLEVSMREGLVHARSGADGRFEIGGLYPGCTSLVSVRAMGDYVPEIFSVKIPSDQNTIELEPLSLLRVSRALMAGPKNPGHPGLRLQAATVGGAIEEVWPSSSAAEAGIEVGAKLIAVDGVDVTNLGFRSSSYLLMGEVGTSVKVQIMTAGGRLQTHELMRSALPWPF